MQTIYKYPFEVQDTFELDMPADAKVIHVATQHMVPCLWALVDTDAPTNTRRFYVRGTGHPVPGYVRHLGTFLTFNDSLVFHLFEE